MPESAISASQGIRIWPQVPVSNICHFHSKRRYLHINSHWDWEHTHKPLHPLESLRKRGGLLKQVQVPQSPEASTFWYAEIFFIVFYDLYFHWCCLWPRPLELRLPCGLGAQLPTEIFIELSCNICDPWRVVEGWWGSYCVLGGLHIMECRPYTASWPA